METVACDFCGSEQTTQVVSQTDKLHGTTDEIFWIVRCNQCGLHFTNPRPSAQEIARYYAKDYSFHGHRSRSRQLAIDLAVRAANGPAALLLGGLPFLSRRLATYVKPSLADPVRD